MTSIQQRAELHRQIWQIANDVRGSVDGWDFKQYVLGALFYRFISENFSSYIEAGDDSICYAKLDDSVITDDIKDDAIKTKGYFIYPSQLFCNVAAKANTNDRLNADLNSIFVAIESSAYGYPSEADIKGLFADFDTTSNRLGNTVKDKNAGTVAKLAMRQPFVLFKGLTFQKLCLPGAFRPGDHHNKMLRPGLCVVHASPQYL